MSTLAGVGFVSRKLCGLLPPALRTQVSSFAGKKHPWTVAVKRGWVCCLALSFKVYSSALRRCDMFNVKRASGCWWLCLLLFDVVSLHEVLWCCTLPETTSSHLKFCGWKMNFLLGWPIFRGYVSFGECISMHLYLLCMMSDCTSSLFCRWFESIPMLEGWCTRWSVETVWCKQLKGWPK